MINYSCMTSHHYSLSQPAGSQAAMLLPPWPQAPKILIATKLSESRLTPFRISKSCFSNREKTAISQVSICGGLSGTATPGCLSFPAPGQSSNQNGGAPSGLFPMPTFRPEYFPGRRGD